MNFVSHFYLDHNLDDSLFFVGVSTPDLVSIFDREIRLKSHRMPLIMENEATDGEISFYNGVMRHFEGDKIFHSSEFFHTETRQISELLKAYFLPHERKRTFFVAHILFELILDRILIQKEYALLDKFYQHFERHPVAEYVRLTEWVTRTSMPGYDEFLERFISRRYLYDYEDWDHVVYVLKRILQRVGISEVDYLYSDTFTEIMEGYEAELTTRCFQGFSKLNEQLYRV